MKKILVAMFAVVFIFTVTGTVMAGKLKPPKNLCFLAVPQGGAYILGIKKGNKIVAGSSKIDMYTVQGIIGGMFPISGSGYMRDDVFIFQLNTLVAANISVIGGWNVVTETGEMNYSSTEEGDPPVFTEFDLVPCGDL